MRGWLVMNLETGELFPARCGRNRCAHCLPLNARRRARAMQWAGVRRTILLTNCAEADDPDPWPTVRRRYNRLREYLKRDGIDPGGWGVFVERGSKTGMVHCHIGQKGSKPIPKAALSAAGARAGIGWTSISAVRSGGRFSDYVGKGFSVYVGKGFTEAEGLANLDLNGGRLGHFSRGFFGSVDGETLGVREAEKRAAEALRTEESGTWVLVPATTGESWASVVATNGRA